MKTRVAHHKFGSSALGKASLLATGILCSSITSTLSAWCEQPKTPIIAQPQRFPLPNKILWAWERAEDLTQIDPREYGVAYLACKILIQGENIKWQTRNRSLRMPLGTAVIPTIRIDIDHKQKATLSEKQIDAIIKHILRASQAPNAAQIQIDFDALQSERDFYRKLIERLKQSLPTTLPLSITALVSWCLFDNWIQNLPIDESVPMMFSLGREREKVLLYFRQHHDFLDSRAKRSLGLSLEDTGVNELMIPLTEKRKIPVRIYVFTRTAWTDKKLLAVKKLLNKL